MDKEIIKQRVYLRIGLGKKGLKVAADTEQKNECLWSSTNFSTMAALPTISVAIDLEIPKERLDLSLPQAEAINLQLKEDRAVKASLKEI